MDRSTFDLKNNTKVISPYRLVPSQHGDKVGTDTPGCIHAKTTVNPGHYRPCET